MSRAWSISEKRAYGRARVCRTWGVSRSTHYARRQAERRPSTGRSRGRPPETADADVVEAIRRVLAKAEALGFRGEGYRKVWARLRHHRIRASKERIRRLMRRHGLLAPHREGRPQGPRLHDGNLIPDAPNRMWGTDATQVMTRLEGAATIFVAVDHYVGDLVGVHAARPGTRFEALEPIHQGIREHFGPLDKDLASALVLRHDNGPQYVSDHFQQELSFLGIESSPSFVRSPQGNGVAERFIRTLKEQLLWVHHFDTVEELRQALLDFKQTYNSEWLLERHRHRTPSAVRREASSQPLSDAA